MAGDWIKIEHALPDKPEVMEMATTLGIDSDAIVGKLIRVWTWFDNHTADGNAPVTVRALLDRYAGVANFVTAMQAVGWLEESNDRLIVRHFDRHNGQTAKSRANTNRRVAKSRSGNGGSVTNVTPAALQKPLPEKRREEKSLTSLKTSKSRCTLDEAKAFAVELGLPESDGEATWHRWEGNGWKNGSNMVRDWKATLRSWKAGGYLPSQKVAGTQPAHRQRGYQENLQLP